MRVVVLSGAGISAESGIDTFRSSDGLWAKHKIEDVATPEAWIKNKKLVLEFYNARRSQVLKVEPNLAHYSLVDLEKFYDVTIITQNIDDLHERAGSSKVIHLHGEIIKGKTSELSEDYIDVKKGVFLGDLYKGKQIRPHVVWFGESVPKMEEAESIVADADLLIIVGTSLNVYPAAGLVNVVSKQCKIVLIDPNNVDTKREVKAIKEVATVGMPIIVNELIAKKKRS